MRMIMVVVLLHHEVNLEDAVSKYHVLTLYMDAVRSAVSCAKGRRKHLVVGYIQYFASMRTLLSDAEAEAVRV